MKFTEILFETLTEEVKNKKLFATLMDKWRTEKPNITEEEGEELFNRFARIQGNLRPDLPQVFTFLSRYDGEHGYQRFEPNNIKDITKYTYSQLKFLLDEYNTEARATEDVFAGKDTAPTPERIEASKNLWFGNQNLVFEKDGLRVYDIADQQMSIRYGYYYHVVYKNASGRPNVSDRDISPWCVTWRPDMGKSNMWGNYRTQGRSFYFVIDENKDVTDQYYISTIQRDPGVSSGYRITSMMNNGDNVKTWDEIVQIYPQLRGEKDVIKNKPFSQEELTLKDIVGQINERPGNRYEFKRMERDLKRAYIQNGGALQSSDSWKSMDNELRNLYILYPNLDRNSVRERYNNFDFVNEIRKVGNEFNLLDRTLKQKGINDGAAYIFDYLMSSEFRVARVSADNKNIRIYESKMNGKSGLYNIKNNDWVEFNGVKYEPLYRHIDTDMYNDSEGETYVVEVYSKTNTPTDDSFYSMYLFGDANPEFDSHFLSSTKWRELVKELTPEDGTEPKTDSPKDYTDIKEKRGI
jgi:hypothetical protein